MADNNCEHRLGHKEALPVVYSGKGKFSDKLCNFLLHDEDEMLAPMCKAPDSNATNCPVAKHYKGEITKKEALKKLEQQYGV